MLPGKLAFVTGKWTNCTQIKHYTIDFVTGAGGGIGRAICRLMAQEGATVVAADLNINNVQSTVLELTGIGRVYTI